MLSIHRAGEIDLFENLDIVHIRLLVVEAIEEEQGCRREGGTRSEAAPRKRAGTRDGERERGREMCIFKQNVPGPRS